jgi:hypothetical protein
MKERMQPPFGWEDADTELLESERHSRIVAEGREDQYADTWGLLFDAGRRCPREWHPLR